LVIKTLDPDWIRIGIQPKMLDPDPDRMNADRQPCSKAYLNVSISEYFSCASSSSSSEEKKKPNNEKRGDEQKQER
jgi:hypothetical protein